MVLTLAIEFVLVDLIKSNFLLLFLFFSDIYYAAGGVPLKSWVSG